MDESLGDGGGGGEQSALYWEQQQWGGGMRVSGVPPRLMGNAMRKK